MSTATAAVSAPILSAPDTVGRPLTLAERARHLKALPSPRSQAPRAPFLIVMGALLAAGLLGLLLLNTTLAQSAFIAHDLQAQTTALADQEQALVQKVAEQESPTVLERRARAIGMVPSSTPVFLRLSDGAVLGVPVPAKAAPKPKVAPAPKTSAVATAASNAQAPTAATTKPAARSTEPIAATTPAAGRTGR